MDVLVACEFSGSDMRAELIQDTNMRTLHLMASGEDNQETGKTCGVVANASFGR